MQKYNFLLKYDEITGRIVNYKDFGTEHSPFFGNSRYAKNKKMVGD